MKETYFTQENIQEKAGEMLREVEGIRRRPNLDTLPQSTALLVLDMQDYFLDPESHAFIPSAPAILPGVQSLIDVFTKRELPVVFTQHVNTPQDAGMMGEWWRDLMTEDNPYIQVTDRLSMTGGMLIQKTQYDAFYKTKLDKVLKDWNFTHIVICGVMTHLCCETTARSAFMLGYKVRFTVDGTATYNEDFHMGSLRNLAHGFAVPVLVEEVVEALGGIR